MNGRQLQWFFLATTFWAFWCLFLVPWVQPFSRTESPRHLVKKTRNIHKTKEKTKQSKNRTNLTADLTTRARFTQTNDQENINSKSVNNTKSDQAYNITAGFIHLGKTGGSNFARLLRHGCHSIRPKPCKKSVDNETIISKLVERYYHIPLDTKEIAGSNHDVYVLTTRDVYQRFASAFVYLHPRNKDIFRRAQSLEDRLSKHHAYRCFPNFQVFVDAVGDDPYNFRFNHTEIVITSDCTNLARAIVQGRVQALEHIYNNYQNMVAWIPTSKVLYVIRQEHLWEDWVHINQLLGDTKVVLPFQRVRRNVTATGERRPRVTKDINRRGRDRLCHALQREYQAYFQILYRASNIPTNAIQETIALGQIECPHVNMTAIANAAKRAEENLKTFKMTNA